MKYHFIWYLVVYCSWDIINHTWALTERLRPLVINVDYQVCVCTRVCVCGCVYDSSHIRNSFTHKNDCFTNSKVARLYTKRSILLVTLECCLD